MNNDKKLERALVIAKIERSLKDMQSFEDQFFNACTIMGLEFARDNKNKIDIIREHSRAITELVEEFRGRIGK